MEPERRQQVQRIYHAALELEPDRRGEYLRHACGPDRDLRREVENLLTWHNRAANLPKIPPLEAAALTRTKRYSEPLPGQILADRYRIISLLGWGGMGVVYCAEDMRLGRTVALKFLLKGFTDDAVVLERFRAEARILSVLSHPNICAIYDIGEAESHTYIAMEYIAGKRLDELIAARAINPAEALRYAVQIAAGLSKAHSAGVVHRDLKPANIMVGEDARIKLLDFGVAKLTRFGATDSGTAVTLTQVGALVGTAAYMSPEQAEARSVDARSDVFAFGAVLYEMITGQRAFQGESCIATLAAILRSDPEPVSRISPSVPAELDRIIARCLRKDPERRFQTAADLKVALEEIRDETEAGNRTAVPRILPVGSDEQQARRRLGRGRMLAAIAICLFLIAAVVAGIRVRGRNPWPIPSDKKIAVLSFTNIGRDPANQAFCDGLVEDISNSLTWLEQVQGALVVVPASEIRKEGIVSPGDAGRLLGANLAITGSVERTARGVHVLINLVDTHTVTQLRTESIDAKSPELTNLRDQVMEKVDRMLEFVLKPESKRAVKAGSPSVAAAYPEYIRGLGYLGRYDRPENPEKAISAFRRAVVLDPGYVLAFSGMAEAYWRQYEARKDDSSIEKALEFASKAEALNDNLAPVHIAMGMIRAGKGQYDLAQEEFRTALKFGPRNPRAWLELAKTYDATGQHELAQSSYRKAEELRNDDWSILKQIGVSYINNGHYAEAEPYLRKVVQLRPESAKAYSNLGGLYLKLGRWDDASAQLQTSISIEPTADAWSNLGSSYYFAGRYADAIVPFEKATALTPSNSTLWGNLADAYRWTPGQSAKAPETYRRALELIRKEMAVNDREPQLHAKAAMYYAAMQDREEALSEIARAIDLAPENATVQYRAAIVYEQLRQRDRALRAVESALDAGYDLLEIDKAPPLEGLRKDPRFRRVKRKQT